MIRTMDKNRVSGKSTDDNNRIIYYLIITAVAVLLIAAPFFRGLYFRENYLPSTVYISGIFIVYILYKLYKRDYGIYKSYLDIAVFLLPFVYLLSFMFSENPMDAFDAVLKYAAYYMIYKIVSDLCHDDKYRNDMKYIILLALFIMAAASLMNALGFVDIKGSMVGKRVYGPYQYTNATASALGAGIFLALGSLLNSSNTLEKVFYNMVLSIMFPVFILALSRGAYIIFAALAIINVIIVDARKRVLYIYSLLALAVSNGLFLLKYFEMENPGGSLAYLLIAIMAYSAFQVLYNKVFLNKFDKIGVKSVNKVLIAILGVSIAIVFILLTFRMPSEYKIAHPEGEASSWKMALLKADDIMPGKEYTLQLNVKSNASTKNTYRIAISSINDNDGQSNIVDERGSLNSGYEKLSIQFVTQSDTESIEIRLYNYEENSFTTYNDISILDSAGKIIKKYEKYRYIPEGLANRLSDINFETTNASARVYYVKDGFRIFRDNFLIGTGGGGWKSLYRKYQSFAYNSTEAHNFYLQYAIETGIIGLTVLLAIYFFIGKLAFNSLFKLKNYKELPLYIALLMLMGHAILDFDLSLTALAILFWSIVGLAVSDNKQIFKGKSENISIASFILITSIGVLFLSSSMYYGLRMGNKASSLISSNIEESIKTYETAMKRDPFNMNYHMDYMQIMYSQYTNKKDKACLDKMQMSIDRVIKSGLYDMNYSPIIVNILTSIGDFSKASKIADEIVANNPMIEDAYGFKLSVNYQIARYYFNNNKEKAIPYLKEIIETEQQFKVNNEKAVTPIKAPKGMADIIKSADKMIELTEKK